MQKLYDTLVYLLTKPPLMAKEAGLSAYSKARIWYARKVSLKSGLQDIFLIVIGILSAGLGLKGFLLPNFFLDGGATGIALLTARFTKIPFAFLLIGVNLPFILIAYQLISKQFAIRTVLAIIGLALVTTWVPYPVITQDKLLVAVFGGFFLGAGIGFSVRGGAVIDGTEVLAIALSRKAGLTIGDVILIFNILLFSVAAWLINIETALYAVLTYMAASKAVDFFIEGIEEYTGVSIVSVRCDEIRDFIIQEMGRGVTVYSGKRGYGKRGMRVADVDIVYTVVTRLEVNRLKTEIAKIDPHAFVVMTGVKDVVGGIIKKRRLSH